MWVMKSPGQVIIYYLDTILELLYISLAYPNVANGRNELKRVNLDRLSVKSSRPPPLSMSPKVKVKT